MPIDPYAPLRFRYRDSCSGRWVQSARPRTLDEIEASFDEWQVNGVADLFFIDVPNDIDAEARPENVARHRDVSAANERWALMLRGRAA